MSDLFEGIDWAADAAATRDPDRSDERRLADQLAEANKEISLQIEDAARLRNLVRQYRDERDKARGILDQSWDAAGLLSPHMTGQPDQAWQTPSDLVGQIEDLASKADNRDEAEAEAERLAAENEILVDVLREVGCRLDYLRNLWGDEAITKRLVDRISATLADVPLPESEADDD